MILLTVDEDPAVIEHALAILRKFGGQQEVHTAGSLAAAEQIARSLAGLDILIIPAIASNGESFFALRDSLRQRFPQLHVLFLNDYDISAYQGQIGNDRVLPRRPEEQALAHWAQSIGFGVTATHATAEPGGGGRAASEALLEGSPELPSKSTVPVAVTAVPSSGVDEDELPVAGLVETPADQLGDYKLVRIIASHSETETHEAVQLSIGRTVALVLLKPERFKDNEALREFRGAVRAKAAVSHPYITPVYEAHEEDGSIFYTRELVEGLNLPQLASTGKKINQRTLIQIIQITAECFKFMRANGIRHNDLEPRHIYLGQDAQVRLTNIAALNPKNLSTPAGDIAKVAAAVRPLVSEKPTENGLVLPLLDRMEGKEFESWEGLLVEAQELGERLEETQTYSVSGRSPLGVPVNSKKSLLLIAAAAVAISAVAAFVVIPSFNKPKPIDNVDMPRIPAGEFIFGDGERRTIQKPFWIDKYEVTIAQYAEFLAALDEGEPTRFDHPDQAEKAPDKVDHNPDQWEDYYAAARDGRAFQGSPINLNCPIVLVDWWDAHAYATWKGHRLPTEEEWAKAARGAEGNLFPWGNTIDHSKFNSKEDGDRFTQWSPVDAMPEDVSPYGVIATAGNVSEWTASTDTHPEYFDRSVPIVRGANFASPEDRYQLNYRRHAISAEDRSIYTGFRTVSDIDPSL